MAPRYIETPYDFTDKHRYTAEGSSRTIRTNAPGSIASHPSSSSATPSLKTYHTEYDLPNSSLKHLRDAYMSLPSLDYEYKARPKPKPATKHKAINGHVDGGQRTRSGTRLTNANARSVNNYPPTIVALVAPSGTTRRNRENMAPSSTSAEHPAPDYEYAARHHRVHAPPAYKTVKFEKGPAQSSFPPTGSELDTYDLYDRKPGASWYHPAPSTPTPTSRERNELSSKESASWYRPRSEEVTTDRPVLRKSKARINRASVLRTSLVPATPTQERSVKTWYAGVRRKLFRKGAKA
ncbi:hypothetical protein D9619_007556 [Psilocybe cf. subviscida]|uniref:Uncharacterized protein n=1 Tax=Psilocybe cf. subviscida TaxID=2480587 RepID=A0A8H5EWJ5_9AGAR|nr:hypothetical protein D9619_007556 [Psilocybe cf. subviscida]